MRWIYRNRIVGFGAYPAVENTAARKYQRVYAVVVDDGHFQIAIKRRGCYGLPIHTGTMGFRQAKRFDLDQLFIPLMPTVPAALARFFAESDHNVCHCGEGCQLKPEQSHDTQG